MVNTMVAIWIYFIRGLSGTGKSTLARQIHASYPEGAAYVRCADDFFYLWRSMEGETDLRWDDTLDVEAVMKYPSGAPCHYNYDSKLVTVAHAWCQEEFKRLIQKDETRAIILPNTFSCRWEIEVYLKIVKELGYRNKVRPVFIDLFDQHTSSTELAHTGTHNVPEESIDIMKARWEHDLFKGDPRPPWKRSY